MKRRWASKRVVSTFDVRALEAAQQLQRSQGHHSLAETVRQSIQVLKTIEDQKAQGFSELCVRHPNGQERVICR